METNEGIGQDASPHLAAGTENRDVRSEEADASTVDTSLQSKCAACGEDIAETDDFNGQYIECANCHRRWHPHPDMMNEQNETILSICGVCHMPQRNLESFANVRDEEYLLLIGDELTRADIKDRGKKHNELFKLIEHYCDMYFRHRDYASFYLQLVHFLERAEANSAELNVLLIQRDELVKERDKLMTQARRKRNNRKKDASDESSIADLHVQIEQLDSQITTVGRRISALRDDRTSYYDAITFNCSPVENLKALAIILESMKRGLVIKSIVPKANIPVSNHTVIVESLEQVQSYFPELLQVPKEIMDSINLYRTSACKNEWIMRVLHDNYQKLLETTKEKLPLTYKRVGICPNCESAPVYIDEKENYVCAGCRVQICKICFRPLTNPHTCKTEDVKEWKYLLEETKACPHCGFRFGHHSRCKSMFCTNCFGGFNYDTGAIIRGSFDNDERNDWLRKLGRQDNGIMSTFRQLSPDIQSEVINNIPRRLSSIPPFAAIVESVMRIWERNIIKGINEATIVIMSKLKFNEYDKNMSSVILVYEILKELLVDYTIDIISICETANGLRGVSIRTLVDNDIDIRFHENIEKMVKIINRLYSLFPPIAIPIQFISDKANINRIFRHILESFSEYLIRAQDMRDIRVMNDVFTMSPQLPKELAVEYSKCKNAIARKIATMPRMLPLATTIDEVFTEYRRRYNIPNDIAIRVSLRKRYREITLEGDEYIAVGVGAITVEDVMNTNIKATEFPIFKYISQVGKPMPGLEPPPAPVVEAPPVINAETQRDDERIEELLRAYCEEIHEEYDIRHFKIYHRTWRNLYHRNNQFYLIEHRTEEVPLPFDIMIRQRIRYGFYHPFTLSTYV